MAWLAQWWTILIAAAVIFLPGLVAAWSVGLRRLGAWAFAPVGSVAIVSLIATAYGVVGVPWTLTTALCGVIGVAAALVGARYLLRIGPSRPRVLGRRWLVWVALTVAAALLTVRITVYIGDPGNISQTNDASFHLGAVRAIIEDGHASSFGLAGLIDPAALGGFYPGGWHATDSLISMILGGIPAISHATNALTLIVAAAVWPLGIAWLTQVATRRRLAAAAAAAMSAGMVIFPLEMMQYGVLYSYFFAVALLPAGIAAVVALTTRHRPADTTGPSRVAAVVLAGGMAALAIVIAQPSVVLAWGLALWIYAAGGVLRLWRRGADGRGAATVATMVGLAALAAVWWVLGRSVTADVWSPVRSGRDAFVMIITARFAETPPAWWIAVLLIVGLIAMTRRRSGRWLAVGWVAFAFLAFVAYAVRNETVRVLLVGPWYSDPYRLSALVPTMMIPVAAVGAVWLIDLTVLWLRRRRTSSRTTGRGGVRAGVEVVGIGALLVIGVGVVAAEPLVLRHKLGDGTTETESPFLPGDDAWLDPDERALIARLPDEVPDSTTVLANPHTGAALSYYLSGVDVFPAKWQVPTAPAYTLLKQDLPAAATDPAVCQAVQELNAGYVLDFGEGDSGPGRVEKMPGFTGFEGARGFELVDSEGDAKLWRITACG